MLKRFTSVILSLCIVATIFAGLNFSAFAAASDANDNTVNSITSGMEVEATRNEWLTNNGYEPSKSIIRDYASSKTKVYYYISSKEENPEFANVNTLTYGQPTRTTKTEGIELFTGSTISTGDTRLVSDYDLARRMFLTYNTTGDINSKPAGVVNDETKQYLQLNFELPAETDISSYVLMWGLSSGAHHTIPGHWKIFVADNEAGLWEDANCVSHVDNISATSDRVVGVNFGTAKRGKWLGLRLICPYNTSRSANLALLNNLAWIRLAHFGVQGTYTNTASADGVTAKATNDNGEAEVSAVATLAGNTDSDGKYPYTSVALTASAGFNGSDRKTYVFDGWYLGEDKIADTATATYILKGTETTKEFTAKYKEYEFIPYSTDNYDLTSTRYGGQLDNYPASQSLIKDKNVLSAQLFNTVEGDAPVSNVPQEYVNLSDNMQYLTSSTNTNGGPSGGTQFFGDSAYSKAMFLDTTFEGDTVVSIAPTDDETKQWIQVNYELDGEAKIENVLFGAFTGGTKWAVSHFKLILSDTEEGLYTLGAAKAVIDVNGNLDESKRGSNWNFNFAKKELTAKYIGVRVIGMYNDYYESWSAANYSQAYPRFNHLGVHGTYVDPIESTENVIVEAQAQEGLPQTLVSKGEGFYGNPDKNGDYGAYYIPVVANKNYTDILNAASYTFEGWYVGEKKISVKTEYNYNIADGSATLTAKYTKGDLDLNAMVVDSTLVNKYKNKLNSTENLMQEGYTYGYTDHLTWDDAGTISWRENSVGSVSKPLDNKGTLNLIDGDLGTHVDILEPKFFDNDHNLIEGNYVDVVINLLHVTELNALFVGLTNSLNLRASKYSVYVSETGVPFTLLPNEKEGADASKNRVFEFTNVGNDQCQVFEFPEGTRAKYIGIRIYNPIAIGKEGEIAASVSYARLAELGVFGKYDLGYYNYTYTSNMGNLVSESGEAYNGQKLTFDAPLTKDGYSFKNFTVNGTKADATVDKDNNTASIKAEITAETQIVAVYENDPTVLTSSNFAISKDQKYVSVAEGTIAHALTVGFDQYKNNIAVKDGDTVLGDHEFVETGMKVVLSAAGQEVQELEVVLRSDYDNDNDVDVTDIMFAIEVIVNGEEATEYGSFAFDNGDGKFNVTDIVNARKAILETPSTADYTEKTYTMKTLKYKTIGRTQDSAGERLMVKHAASGIIFNADCYGDVKVTMASAQFTHLTVVVDGVEHIIRTDYRGDYTYIVAEDLEPGVHTIEIYNQKAQDAGVTYASVTVNGEVLDAPKDKDILIEFVGDSITCGVGNNSKKLDAYNDDATKAYGRLTAMALDADWSNISLGGSTVVGKDIAPESTMVMPENYILSYRGGNDWDFENERNADIVVINLGTNEFLKTSGDEAVQAAFEDALYAFAKNIIALNSNKDVKIVFAFGMMTDADVWVTACYQNVVARLAAEGINVPYCQLPINTEGAAAHPDAEGHVAAAAVLSQFIKDNVLN